MSSIEIDVDPIEFVKNLYGEVPELMQHIYASMPFGDEIKLSNGRTGVMHPFIEPREREGMWEFGFDIKFTDGASPDHLEFMVKHTGGGGMVMAPHAPPIAISGRA